MQARVNDAVINFEIEGPEGSPVVTFSHSLAAALDMWEFQVSALRDSYRVLRLDIRGHGKSSIPPGPCTMEKLGADVVGLLDYLDIRRTHFVGLSLGGMIGQVLALQCPHRLEKLVLCSTTGSVPSEMSPIWMERIRKAETQGMSALAQETLERWLSEDFRRNRQAMTERVKNMIVQTPVPGYVECCRAISEFDVSRELPKVTVPTLIMVGERDPSTPVSASEAIHEKIRDSELVIIPGALHLTNIETAAFFNDRLLDFLAKRTCMATKAFEAMYEGVPPWDIDGPQSEIVHLAEHGELRSAVLDVGCGTGENALYLAGLGFEVVGIDIVPTAVEKALGKARERSLAPTFLVWDALGLQRLGGRFNTVIDSGLFHVLPDAKRPVFVKSLASVLNPGGTYFIMCFSEHEPGSWGPRRVTQAQIRESFQQGWQINYIREAKFDTNVGSRKCNAWLSSITLIDGDVVKGQDR